MKNRMTRAERQKLMRKRRRKRIALLVAEVLILAALCVTAYGIFKLDKLDFNILNDKNLEAYKDTGPYTNIALFGLDSRNDELDGGVQSDCIMIASINNDTSDVTLTSIYRDTLLQQKDGTYEKANSAYNRGGPEEAISLLNRNFDLDIHNYVSVNFTALVNTIDLLGGLELDMTAEEADWCNKYAVETAEVAGTVSYTHLYVEDHCKAIDLIIHNGRVGEVYNIGGHNEMTNLDIVKIICKELGKPESLITYVEDRKGHDMRYAIDPTKIHSELGWLPETKFADGIKKTIKWYLDNKEWWETIISGEYQNYYDEMYGSREGMK